MSGPFQCNPFPVVAWFDYSITLTFAVPVRELAARLPPCLEVDSYDDKWGFLAVALVRTRGLRPKGMPGILGRDFLLAGYRHFVRYQSASGRRLRGLQIIRSETDKRSMVTLGNIFTPYLYQYRPIVTEVSDDLFTAFDENSGFRISVQPVDEEDENLPEGSVFPDWRAARRFCGPMPYTFSYDADKGRVLVIEGQREKWKPKSMKVIEYNVPYLKTLGFSEVRLATAFTVRDVPYSWKKGRAEAWPSKERNA
ncbi:hypothetical protein NT6N_34940 [Oceaniferula spumae]|uniref:Uncharacterized protein n=1 Tax=Oceaniferula spumae TaxID=2979115 RepID=A0AAT9FR24_9BACT